MKKYLLIIAAIFLSVTFDSCNKELNINQLGAIETDEYYANATDAEAQALIAYIYKQVYANTGKDWISMWAGLANDNPQTGSIYSDTNVSSTNHPATTLFAFFYNINYLSPMLF